MSNKIDKTGIQKNIFIERTARHHSHDTEWIYEIVNFPKYDPKNFCPMYYKNSQVRNPSNFGKLMIS